MTADTPAKKAKHPSGDRHPNFQIDQLKKTASENAKAPTAISAQCALRITNRLATAPHKKTNVAIGRKINS